jgi:Holliday junction resolvase RusA-like endonuclease
MEPVIIELPGVIRGKGRPRFVRSTGRSYTPEQTRSYEAVLKMAAIEAMGDRLPLLGPVRLYMDAVFEPAASMSKKKRAAALIGESHPTKKPDADNIAKLTDALNGVVWKDDAQVVDLSLRKTFGPRPILRIRVEAL